MRSLLPALGVLVLVAVPCDWRPLRDAKAHCQLLVPPDWTGGASVALAPGHRAAAAVRALSRETRFDQAVLAAKGVMKPLRRFEDGPDRVWYAYDAGVPGTVFWYVAVAGEPVCVAQLEFGDPQLEETARLVAGSLSVSRPLP